MRFSILLASSLLLTACSGGSPCPEPLYDGKASDEAWRTMLDGESRATKNDAKVVTFSLPTEGMQLPNAMPATFKWTTPLTASLTPAPAGPSRRASMLSRLGELVYSSAWAHLPPVTGPLHLIRITGVPNRTCPVEVVTTKTEWTPSAETWTLLKGGATLKMDVFSAYLQENRIAEGPYHFTNLQTFSVAP